MTVRTSRRGPRTMIMAALTLLPATPLPAQHDQHAPSPLRDTVELYSTDRSALNRRYNVDYSPARRTRFRDFYSGWRGRLQRMDFNTLNQEGQIDYILLDTELRYELTLLDREEQLIQDMASLVPFAGTIFELEEARRQMGPIDPPALARTLTTLAAAIDSAHNTAKGAQPSKVLARRAAMLLDDVDRTLGRWHGFYAGYDPVFTWWAAEPYKRADQALGRYTKYLRETVAGIEPGEPEPIIGDPIGEAGLQGDLRHEMIAYTIPELIAIAEREYAWCEAELKEASREMGFGDDWRAALEQVKQTYVAPGDQPALILELAREAEQFVEARDLVTVPPLAKEVWRMEMMSPERQRVAPFFLGGEVILVSYPTDGMTHEEKMMSMRGNNPYFSRAVVHHELNPGHHLQGFMTSRYNAHRGVFSTPFWGEGWALYWEMLLWDLGFPQTPEQKMGMLFWRTHRAARIIFSLKFHLGEMTPQEAVDFLVTQVGHERANAEGEVRRSFSGDYSPLYQAAYMLGGLQFRALHRDLVQSGRMTDREFHDAILQGGRMPVEMVRVRLTGEPLTRQYAARWRFYDRRP